MGNQGSDMKENGKENNTPCEWFLTLISLGWISPTTSQIKKPPNIPNSAEGIAIAEFNSETTHTHTLIQTQTQTQMQ